MTDKELAARILRGGYSIEDARMLPNDLIEGLLALKRGKERRILELQRMTAAEAAHRLAEVRDEGWRPLRWIRIGAPRRIGAHLLWRRAIA